MSEWIVEKYASQIDELYAEIKKLKRENRKIKKQSTFNISHLVPDTYNKIEIPQMKTCVHLYGLEGDWEATNQVFVNVEFGKPFNPKNKEDVDEIFNFCPYCGVKFIK